MKENEAAGMPERGHANYDSIIHAK